MKSIFFGGDTFLKKNLKKPRMQDYKEKLLDNIKFYHSNK